MGAEAIEIRQSRQKAGIGLLLATAMLAGGIWLIFQGEPHSAKGAFARYVATPIFGILTLIWLKTFLMPATLVLSPEGVDLRSFPGGFKLAWPEIAGAKVDNPWFVEKIQFALANGRKKDLPAAWERKPAEMLQAVLEARDRWA